MMAVQAVTDGTIALLNLPPFVPLHEADRVEWTGWLTHVLRKPPTPRRVEVLHVHRLSPRMIRVTFTGDALEGFEWRGPAGHLKLTVPEEGSHEAPMPAPEQVR